MGLSRASCCKSRRPEPGAGCFATAGVKPGTGKPWRRDLGLGGYPDVSLSEARRKAAEARELLSKNIDPITAKREARSAMLAAPR